MNSIKNFYLKLLPLFSGGLLIYWLYEMYVNIKAGSNDRLFLDIVIIFLLVTSFASSLYLQIKRRRDKKNKDQ
ncbi:hypothetical protein IMX26_16730 [Clostridium sp. 'deep sea']|uniref:hypothetical protein n=1 Tax=Clostridium sp. 'deep sea' TaxID=2779445 RepID=UPI0018968509|nr:hypothetical protein [Clostridium sp. 'deep sea']QOR35080.1 hypothetical protein IMX26_16730 [Clostridium sp. 'deep sea']